MDNNETSTVCIPGLGPVSRRALDHLSAKPPTIKPRPAIHIMRDGFPEGRYTVTLADSRVVTFWFKFHRKGPKALMEEIQQRDSVTSRWRALRDLRDFKEAVMIIKGDAYTQAVAYGHQFHACSSCGRPLKRAEWVKLGIGYRCAEAAHPGRVDLSQVFGSAVPNMIGDLDH